MFSKTVLIDSNLLQDTIVRSEESPRLRVNHNFHTCFEDPIQRFLNVLQPDSYIQPHRHMITDAFETFLILKGKIGIVLFNDEGKITEAYKLSPKNGNYGIEIDGRVWHAIFALEEDSVCYELKRGPYDPENAKEFASWAPGEEEDSCLCYFNQLKKHFKEFLSDA